MKGEDRFPGEANGWQVVSQDADLYVSSDPPDPDNEDVRAVSADIQLFDLCLAGSGCVFESGFTMPLQIRYRRFEVAR